MDSSQLQTFPLNSSETAVLFPPHRRRPILSRTYRTLVGILSHCRTSSTQFQTQVDSHDSEVGPIREVSGSITKDKVSSRDALVPFPNSKEPENELVQETCMGENKENVGFQGGSSDKQTAGPKLVHINLMPDDKQEVAPASTNNVKDFLLGENQTGDCVVEIVKQQENVNSVLDIQMDELGMSEQLELDKEFPLHDFSEVLDSFFGTDMAFESSEAVKGSLENGSALNENLYKPSEHELQLKEMEMEKLIYNADVVESTSCQNADEEIEEGEISGEAGVADAPLDALSEDVISPKETTAEMVHAFFQDTFDEEEFICNNEASGRLRHEISDPSVVKIVGSNSNCLKLENRTTVEQMQDCHSQNDSCGRNIETQRCGSIGPCLENLTQFNKLNQENADENQFSARTGKDGKANKKKRKNGPLTKERRAKKKKKERIKRAEKNRKLGVKRLKLQPVLKQKTIVYCRHYLQGRCHEGEKCNFSHDTVPLTKSKPCSHFARHSCMKGDDCPYDHQLSKYPCRNFTLNGFCSRGSDCLFSHEIPAKQSISMTPSVSKPEFTPTQHIVPAEEGSFTVSKPNKPETKFPPPPNDSNSSKLTNKHGPFSEKIDVKSCSAWNSPHKSVEPHAAKCIRGTAGKTPKGVSFLLNGGLSLGDTGNKLDRSSLKTNDGVDVSCETVKVPVGANKLNEKSERVTPRKPRGINFLAFAQPSSEDSSSKMFSNLLSNHNNGAGKSVIDDTGEGKLSCSRLESLGVLKVNRQMNQSATYLAQDVKEKVKETPTTVAHVNFSGFSKIHLDDSTFKEQANLHCNEGDTALSFAEERQRSPSKLQDSFRIPSFSFGGPSDQLTGGQNANLLNSFKTSCLSNTPSSVQKAVQSALAFAAEFEPAIKVGSSLDQGGS